MRTNIKKALAVLLSVLMLCSLLPLSALSVSAAATPALDLNFNDGTNGGFNGATAVKEGPDGSYCLKWTATGGWSNTYKEGVSGVYRDGTYVITFKAKASVAGTMGITIQDGGWANVYYTEYFSTTTSWKEYEITTNVGQNPTSGGKILFKFQDQGTAMDLWIDDLKMVEYEEPAPEVPETTAENLVQNHSFENSNANWSLSSFASIVSGGQDGSYALQIKNPTTQYAANAIQYVDVKPGTGYTLSWWSKRVAGTGVFNLYLDGATRTAGGNAWMNETSGQWVQTVMDIKTGDSATSLMLKFSNEAANTNGTILIDNIVLTQHPEASFDGFIYNGDFEIGSLQNWHISQTASVSAAAAHSGSYGAHITNPGGQYGGMIYQTTVGIEAGKTYTVSLWVKVLQGYVNFQIQDGGVGASSLASKGFNSTAWVQYTATVTPTTNVINLNFCGGGTGTNDQAYVDDVLIVEEKDPTFDGYFYNGDFETGKANPWTMVQSSAVSTDAKKEGNYGLKLAGSGKNYGGLAYQLVNTLKVGKQYNIKLWMKVVADGVNIQVMNGSTSGDKLASGYYATNNAGDWTEITLTFTAVSTTIALNFCGSGNDTAVEVYIDNVTCGRVGGEVVPEALHQWGGNSIKENDDGIGLAFKFDIKAANGQKDYSNKYVESSAQITLDETKYNLVRMGAVMTNNASVGQNANAFNLSAVDNKKTINIKGEYLAALGSETVSFAVRILDIPERHQGTAIYARPYFVYVEDGQEVIVYGGIKSNTYAKVANPKSSIKVLSIGHSFSKDVMVTNLYKMFEQGGYEDITIAYLYMAGCSMPKHLYNINNNLAQYEYSKNNNGTWVTNYNVSAITALKDEDWDFVTLQSSPDYIGGQKISGFNLGMNNEGSKVTLSTPMTEYEAMDQIITWVKSNATNDEVKIDYHMIWSFSQDCKLWSYTYHDFNQMTMYQNIITQTKLNVVTHTGINEIIPSATAIQNARTSFIGDNFNMPGGVDANGNAKDGYHLNDNGDYVAALTWYCHYSGDDAYVMSGYTGVFNDTQFDAVAEAVNNAMEKWDEVTDSTHK